MSAGYGLACTARRGQTAVDADGNKFTKVVYVGASRAGGGDARMKADRAKNKTIGPLVKKGWKLEPLFLDRDVPLGSEDAATTAMRHRYLHEPLTKVLGGVTAALASAKYAFARCGFERLALNSAMGACLRCEHSAATAPRLVVWNKCQCSERPLALPPEERAHREAGAARAALAVKEREVQVLQAKLRERDARIGELELVEAERGSRPVAPVVQLAGVKRPAAAQAGLASNRPARKKPASAPLQWRQRGPFLTALVCGELCTTLSWYCGTAPTGAQNRRLHDTCCYKTDAVQLMGGDDKTLVKREFAGVRTAEIMELLPDEDEVPTRAVASKCLAMRKGVGFVKVRRARSGNAQNLLWRVVALDEAGMAEVA